MLLTLAQNQTLKAFILADPTLSTYPHNSDGDFAIAAALNALASPAFTVTKSSIQSSLVGQQITYTSLAAMTTGNIQALQAFQQLNPATFAPTADVQAFFANIFSGALGGGGAPTRAAFAALWIRSATVLEKLFALGTGTVVSPATLVVEGSITYSDVATARNS
jgi:hypothetical protein